MIWGSSMFCGKACKTFPIPNTRASMSVMFGTLRQYALRNPPWADMDYEYPAFSIIDEAYDIAGWSLQDAVQAKLASIDTNQSVELQRFVVLTAHEFAHNQVKWAEPEPPKPLLYDAYGAPTSFREAFQKISSIIDWGTEEQFQIFESEVHHLRKLLLLNLVFDLIDRVVEYWREVALARHAWRSFSGAFRQFLESALQFKPFHTPLRLFPSSIHPIGSAA